MKLLFQGSCFYLNLWDKELLLLLLFTPWNFFLSALADGLSLEFEWQQVSSTLLSILSNLNNAVVWIDCIKSTNYNWCKHHFHVPQFFNSLARSRYLSLFSLSFNFTLWSAGSAKSTILQVLYLFIFYFFFFFFFLIIIRSGHLAKIRWSVYMSKSYRSLCVSFSRTDVRFCIYHLFVWSNFIFLHISQWITLPTQLCLTYTLSVLICCIRLCDWSFHSIATWSTFAVLLHLIYFCFDMIGPYNIVLCCY